MYASFRLDFVLRLRTPMLMRCLINLQCFVDFGKRLEVRSEEVDVVPDVGRTGSLSDRVHRELGETDVDGPDMRGQVGTDR